MNAGVRRPDTTEVALGLPVAPPGLEPEKGAPVSRPGLQSSEGAGRKKIMDGAYAARTANTVGLAPSVSRRNNSGASSST